MALVATVEPWMKRSVPPRTSSSGTPSRSDAARTALSTLPARSCRSDGALAVTMRFPATSWSTQSVNVPPMSTPML